MQRTIEMILQAQPTLEGAGVHLKRVFGFGNEEQFDPFLMLDDFRSDKPEYFIKGFPWHPHRGIETITYVMKGDVEHGDSLGNSGIISSGDVQWMTAGSGIIHQEMPKGDEHGSMHGFQLWANLPACNKMMAPRYRDVTANQIPTVHLDNGIRAKVIAGTINGVSGPVGDIVIDPLYADVTIPPNTTFNHPTAADYTVFLYLHAGSGTTCHKDIGNTMVVLFGPGDGFEVTAGKDGMSFLLISGKPLGEPIAWRGPIVMNTREELDQAFMEYQQGTFIKHK